MEFVIWLFGLPCSGKTTIAKEIIKRIFEKYDFFVNIINLDGDVTRKTICSDLGFSVKDRTENIKRVSSVAKILYDNEVSVVASYITPSKETRNIVKKSIPSCIMVYVKCSLEECIKRDVKGMYKLALEGKIKNFTGISAPFEEPESPDVIVETDKMTVEECLDVILNKLDERCLP